MCSLLRFEVYQLRLQTFEFFLINAKGWYHNQGEIKEIWS